MARYSGPALAAGAISKAIGEMFEGILAGQRGGLEAQKVIGSEGRAERDALMKAHTLPDELAALRAQMALAQAQTGKVRQETAGMRTLLPHEVAGRAAQTGLTKAQTGEIQTLTPPRAAHLGAETDQTRAQTGHLLGPQTRHLEAQTGFIQGPQTRSVEAQTGLTKAQTGHVGAQTGLVNQQVKAAEQNYSLTQNAITDFRNVQAQAAVQNRPVGEKDLIEWMMRNPVALQGADKIPSGMLFNLSAWEAHLKAQAAQSESKLIFEKFVTEQRAEAFKQAGEMTKGVLGVETLETGTPESIAIHNWLAKQQLNAAMKSPALKTLFPGQAPYEDPGNAPGRLVNYLAERLKTMAGGTMPDQDIKSLAYGVGELMRSESLDIEQALARVQDTLFRDSGGAPGTEGKGYDTEYDPKTGSFGSLPNMP